MVHRCLGQGVMVGLQMQRNRVQERAVGGQENRHPAWLQGTEQGQLRVKLGRGRGPGGA